MRPSTDSAAAEKSCTAATSIAYDSAWETYYINLDSRPDRRMQMEQVLRNAGITRAERVRALTPVDLEVVALTQLFPDKSVGYHANVASHSSIWRRIAKEGYHQHMSIIFEDDIVLHCEWKQMLRKALEEIHQLPDCFLLDGIFVTGEVSAKYGWLGPSSIGVHPAECMAYSSAYALSPAAASWLLTRMHQRPGYSTESYLMQLQEERRNSWTHTPRLALQRWDEAVSSVSGPAGATNMRKWYEKNYFPLFAWSFYQCPPRADVINFEEL